MTDFSSHIPLAEKACEFLSSSPDPYHAVKNVISKLEGVGYVRLSKREPFSGKLEPGGKYYYTLNKTTLVAFAVGPKYKPGNGFKVIGGHTDSPNLKVRPRSKRSAASGCIQLGVDCYGGGLWHTWFDRDLGISGRVLVREKKEEEDKVVQKFVKIDKPVARVSTLCIHLQSADERRAFQVKKEDHLMPILGTQTALENGVKDQLTGGDGAGDDAWRKEQEPLLLKLLASELDVDVKDIADFELNLFDTQPATLGGVTSEFLYSARLDNLATCFVSCEALADYTDSEVFKDDCEISLVALFDHEEVGSDSAQGAGSPVMAEAVKRISTALSPDQGSLNLDIYGASIRKSFVLSVDMAHAVHPNYASKHEKYHSPKMNAGVVIKANQNQRYATNTITGFLMREIARKAGLMPLQEFVVRNDCPCGTTIGPIISANTGMRTIDIGMPQLSMHSCREVMGIADLTNCLELFKAFFQYFRKIDNNLEG
mmetsp:Transcript_7790/g.10646  ORF Transcript_7790/g.10646 Transcript_7790/m.10646 type:complete len:484 (-) Transcript_7790:391-1842(-)|eukprot:CAMPEP_0185739442 /NCGR_PEP_ID=MMETSP1171-20130828/35444_1 /TAXON_ID=374046 /ORGANISM="Helicotheca tamensis, Strain CCMP826" /LENGTH=483 /DNA_ID=CAMNT_0028411011 /DNA_START=60 /DNA_END=1511 /DNA_ORIENTATION=-